MMFTSKECINCFVIVCIIRDTDFHSDLYGLQAIICARKFFFHFVFLSIKSAVVGSWSPYDLKFESYCPYKLRLKIDVTIITVEC